MNDAVQVAHDAIMDLRRTEVLKLAAKLVESDRDWAKDVAKCINTVHRDTAPKREKKAKA